MSSSSARVVTMDDAGASVLNSRQTPSPAVDIGPTVIVIGGGDTGGLLISKNGIRPIPALESGLRQTLKSVAMLLRAIAGTRDENFSRKLSRHVVGLCNLAVDQMEQILGPLDADRAIVYQDSDGGFSCGATGKAPLAFPWPPNRLPSISDLISAGAVGTDLVALLTRASAEGIDLIDVFERPGAIADELGVSISEKTLGDLSILAPSRLQDIKEEVDREICGLLHAVARHGGYWQDWLERPYEVSRALGVPLSDAALERIASRGAGTTFAPESADKPKTGLLPWLIVPIAVVGIAAATYTYSAEHRGDVVDHSDRAKL